MQKRQELYQMEIKRKHRPKIDESKRQEIEERLIQEQRKKEKVVSLLDSRKLGEGYLEISKSLKRFQSLSHYKKNIEQPMIVGKSEDLHQSLQIRHSS